MTNEEFSKFMNRLRIAFPDIWEWLSGFEDHTQTQACWRETLRPFSLTECLLIIDSWINRTRPAPKRYDFGQLAIIVANSIEFDRAKQRQVNGGDRERFKFAEQSRAEVLRKRNNYQPIESNEPSMSAALQAGRQLRDKLDKGEITEGEFYKRKQEILNAL